MRVARPARLLAALTLTVVLLAAAGCSSSDNGSTAKNNDKTEIGDAATVSSTRPSGSETTVTTGVPTSMMPSSPTGLDTPKAAAERLYSTWKAGDRAGALSVAEPVAVDAVFTAAPGDYRLYSGCDTGEFAESGCLYRGDAGTIQFDMEKRNNLWVVVSAFYAAN